MTSTKIKIGIIGGSGLSKPDILSDKDGKYVDTPYGKPSDALICGKIKDVDCVLLSRHGRGHSIMPTNVNFRANIWAMKEEGCTHLLVTTACGSLQHHAKAGDIVVLDQFIDRTQKRSQTLFDGVTEGAPQGICHMPMAEPFCVPTSKILYDCAKELGLQCHPTGTALTIEGPRFSSKAESKLWHASGADIVNMTTVPEVVLAKEAGLCYAALALVTDYDSWNDEEKSADLTDVMETFKQNSENALKVLLKAISVIAEQDWTKILKQNQDMVKANTLLPNAY